MNRFCMIVRVYVLVLKMKENMGKNPSINQYLIEYLSYVIVLSVSFRLSISVFLLFHLLVLVLCLIFFRFLFEFSFSC